MICSTIRTDFGILRESERRYRLSPMKTTQIEDDSADWSGDTKMISIHSIFVGRPQRITDETGVWEFDRLDRGAGQRSAGSMLEAGAEVKAARIPETNHRGAANRVLRAGFAMRHRASRRHLAPEISAEPLGYSARSE